MNIPIFRAKQSINPHYAKGYLIEDNDKYFIKKILNEVDELDRIDEKTIAIHFPDMLDKDNGMIFASLEEFGKGGDIITDGEYDFVVIFNGRGFDLMFVEDNTFTKLNEWDDWNKFTKKGIQQ